MSEVSRRICRWMISSGRMKSQASGGVGARKAYKGMLDDEA